MILLALLIITSAKGSTEPTKVIPASEVLVKIERGELVEYDQVTIMGDLDLRPLYPRIIGTIKITNSTIFSARFDNIVFGETVVFTGTSFRNASFNNTKFAADADFENANFENTSFINTIFGGGVIFAGAEFRNEVRFSESQFGQLTDFDRAVFKDNANFDNARFLGDASFVSAQFEGDVNALFAQFGKGVLFNSTQFRGIVNVHGTKFDGGADFSAANFTNKTFFNYCIFGGPTTFYNTSFLADAFFGFAEFDMVASFDGAKFAGEADFNMARFNNAISFDKTHFMDMALLGGVKFDGLANLRGATFEKNLNLKSSQIYTFLLENATFRDKSKIILQDTDFAKLRANWSSIKDHIGYDDAVYLALVKNYKDLGWFPDSDDCYFNYREKRDLRRVDEWWFLDSMYGLFGGYGVNPYYPLAWSILTIVAFGFFFWVEFFLQGVKGIKKFAREEEFMKWTEEGPTEESTTTRSKKMEERILFMEVSPRFYDPFYFSLNTFTSGVTSFIYPSTDFEPAKKYIRTTIILERLLGSVFIAFVLSTLVHVIIR